MWSHDNTMDIASMKELLNTRVPEIWILHNSQTLIVDIGYPLFRSHFPYMGMNHVCLSIYSVVLLIQNKLCKSEIIAAATISVDQS